MILITWLICKGQMIYWSPEFSARVMLLLVKSLSFSLNHCLGICSYRFSYSCLKAHIQKTKIMASGPITSWDVDDETVETVSDFIFWGSKITADGDCSHEIKRCLLHGRQVMTNLDSTLKSRDITLPTKVRLAKAMIFPLVMYGCELNGEESWALKNWCFWTVVLEKTLKSPLDCKEIQPVHPKGDQSWVFIGRTDVEAETPILWPPNVTSWLISKDPDAGKDWRQEEKGMTEDKMVGWHHQLNGHEFGWTLGVDDGQGSLECCSPWGRKESDTTERLNWTELILPMVKQEAWNVSHGKLDFTRTCLLKNPRIASHVICYMCEKSPTLHCSLILHKN